ncbi:transcription termination factor 2 [Aplysia californica]|uniref:Transcription termination factor 2 n=1 Tax=Aplysia californica TaxID=6500 RepID=A0ABM0K2P2_APLCA|nr:transcription termination factor 2 [Aplysia californica]
MDLNMQDSKGLKMRPADFGNRLTLKKTTIAVKKDNASGDDEFDKKELNKETVASHLGADTNNTPKECLKDNTAKTALFASNHEKKDMPMGVRPKESDNMWVRRDEKSIPGNMQKQDGGSRVQQYHKVVPPKPTTDTKTVQKISKQPESDLLKITPSESKTERNEEAKSKTGANYANDVRPKESSAKELSKSSMKQSHHRDDSGPTIGLKSDDHGLKIKSGVSVPQRIDVAHLLKQKDSFEIELQQIQSRLKGIKLDCLPDNGKRIIDSIEAKKQNIRKIDQQIEVYMSSAKQSQGVGQSGAVPMKNSGDGAKVSDRSTSAVDTQVNRVPVSRVMEPVPHSGNDLKTVSSSSRHKVIHPPQLGTQGKQVIVVKKGDASAASVQGKQVFVVKKGPSSQVQMSNSGVLPSAHGSSGGVSMAPGPQRQAILVQQSVPHLSHLPLHLQQFFAANPQAMTLYGGRMTAQRLREVGSITTEAIDKLHKQLETCPSDETETPDPAGLNVTLMPHQRHALAWLSWREQQHPPGGILADDMGLGKTLTTISHILRLKQAREEATDDEWQSRDKEVEKLNKAIKKSKATLIIAPASLIHQWGKEIERRCRRGSLKFHLYHGPTRETNIKRLTDNDIVITSYSIVAKEVGQDKSESAEQPATDGAGEEQEDADGPSKQSELPLLLRIGWERIILDEGHNIKNHKSVTAMSVCRLRAAYRFVLTGTPIQNNLLDMYSLLRFLRFSPFDELKVWKRHIDSGRGDTKRLNTIVKALLLRRTKEDTCKEGKPIVDLPNRSSQTIDVHLSEEERRVYDKLFRRTQRRVQEYIQRHEEKGSGVSGHSRSLEGAPAHGTPLDREAQKFGPSATRSTGSDLLVLLLRLRQCCSHLSLMKEQVDTESLETDGIELTLEEQMRSLTLGDFTDEKKEENAPLASKFDKKAMSTKLKCVLDKIQTVSSADSSKKGDKCVIVSQWTQMLEIVGHHLSRVGILYSVIQGNIPAKKRMDIVDDFNSNPRGAKVMLVSLRAGGVGLNLIGGNHLFLLDNHWNPALEEQACDRIYRMGQKKDVFIYRYLCKDTIEEKIVALQQRKMSLAKSVLSGSGVKSQKLSLSDLRMLFGV